MCFFVSPSARRSCFGGYRVLSHTYTENVSRACHRGDREWHLVITFKNMVFAFVWRWSIIGWSMAQRIDQKTQDVCVCHRSLRSHFRQDTCVLAFRRRESVRVIVHRLPLLFSRSYHICFLFRPTLHPRIGTFYLITWKRFLCILYVEINCFSKSNFFFPLHSRKNRLLLVFHTCRCNAKKILQICVQKLINMIMYIRKMVCQG